jgi:isoamylase
VGRAAARVTAASRAAAPRRGATVTSDGVSLAVWAGTASRVDAVVTHPNNGTTEIVELSTSEGGRWHGFVPGARAGMRYSYRVSGERGTPGDRFNPSKLLLDPYARAVAGTFEWHESHFDNDLDNSDHMPRAVATIDDFDWRDDSCPNTPWADTVIYETHVKGLTELHPGVAPELRGTYLGASSQPITDHIRSIGATAVELLPIHVSIPEAAVAARGLGNYWGYNTLGFFAPHPAFAAAPADGRSGEARSVESAGIDVGEAAVAQFKEMVRRFHRAGIEVILDVVYNHTAESGADGPILSFRGFDNAGYYRHDPTDPSVVVDTTGCGNTLDLSQPMVLDMVIESLCHWSGEMRVDGFRFDLATALAREGGNFDPDAEFFRRVADEPRLAHVKLIAEPWDLGDNGYQVGAFPARWSEWNGNYRDTVRDFWRGEDVGAALALRLAGSPDLYRADGRPPQASINFVTAHDGFTMADLVSYDERHNWANGENNVDGTSDDRSWNCGVEGPTADPDVSRIRARQQRNFAATLWLSQGVPMLLGGDEFARTQGGMNNAYTQDNETSWFDWPNADAELLEFWQTMARIRADHPSLHRGSFDEDAETSRWFAPEGAELDPASWPPGVSAFAMVLAGEAPWLVIVNADAESTEFTLPPIPSVGEQSNRWVELVSTGTAPVGDVLEGEVCSIEGRSLSLFAAGV